MKQFSGFLEDTNRLVPVPVQFFSELLTQIDQFGELKITLFALGFIGRSGDYANCILMEDFTTDPSLMSSLGNDPKEAETALNDSLERAVQRGSLIRVNSPLSPGQNAYYFINTPRGRAAAQSMQQGNIIQHTPMTIEKEKPNIFGIYEANIGPLTPMIADTLRDAEMNYSPQWIEEAIQIAVQNNIRRWRYVEAILKSWKEEGHHGGDQRNAQEDYRRYVKGKFGQFGKR